MIKQDHFIGSPFSLAAIQLHTDYRCLQNFLKNSISPKVKQNMYVMPVIGFYLMMNEACKQFYMIQQVCNQV